MMEVSHNIMRLSPEDSCILIFFPWSPSALPPRTQQDVAAFVKVSIKE